MRRERTVVWIEVALVVIGTPVAFFLLQAPARTLELHLDVGVLRLLGVGGLPLLRGSAALVVPHGSARFWVVLEPSCSALASVLTLGVLTALLPRRLVGPRSKLLAFAAAAAAIVVGNLIRIDLSIAAGLVAGRSSLVLFHDWVGSVFGFAYTLLGFILMLRLLLPARQASAADTADAVPVAVGSLP